MSYINKFFGKHDSELSIDDVSRFFSEKQYETSTLEFKSGEVEINDIFKEIAAFLNTEGGLLIIGSPKETKEQDGKKTITYCSGEVTYSKFVSKDWLHQKIYSNIIPSPANIRITELSNKEGNIFILDIPQSETPPHQSNADGRYYIRIDNQAKPAPHGLVQALFDKRRKAKIFARIRRNPIDDIWDTISFTLHNNTTTPTNRVSFLVDIYNVVLVPDNYGFKAVDDEVLGSKYSLSGNIGQVLVQVVSYGFDFKLAHNKCKYIISVSYWSEDVDYDSTYFVIDPINSEIDEKHWLTEGSNLIDAITSVRRL